MARIDRKDFDHRQPARIGVLLTVLGTPKAPTAKEVRPWLRQFLSDTRVVEIPRLVWWLILNGIILLVNATGPANASEDPLPIRRPAVIFTTGWGAATRWTR